MVNITVEAATELDSYPARFRGPILEALWKLEFDADVKTKHRHPMTGKYAPRWQVAVGDYRAFYFYDDDSVSVESVRFKGRKTTGEVY